MNILVTGANGQLGTEIRNRCGLYSDRFIFTDVSEIPGVETVNLDITNIAAVRIIAEAEKIDAIINCAAYTNVDAAEDDADFANLLNNTAVKNLATVAAERNALLVHISTDYVFSGEAFKPIPETAEPDPRSVYGATKLAGEKAVENSGCKYMIIRTAWLYSPYGKNFVKTMLKLTNEKDSLKVVADQVGTPTYAGDLADFILFAIAKGPVQGIYHFTNEGVISWYDFTQAIAFLAGNVCDIRPCASKDYPAKASRPNYSVLDKSRVRQTYNYNIPYWFDSLRICIEKLK